MRAHARMQLFKPAPPSVRRLFSSVRATVLARSFARSSLTTMAAAGGDSYPGLERAASRPSSSAVVPLATRPPRGLPAALGFQQLRSGGAGSSLWGGPKARRWCRLTLAGAVCRRAGRLSPPAFKPSAGGAALQARGLASAPTASGWTAASDASTRLQTAALAAAAPSPTCSADPTVEGPRAHKRRRLAGLSFCATNGTSDTEEEEEEGEEAVSRRWAPLSLPAQAAAVPRGTGTTQVMSVPPPPQVGAAPPWPDACERARGMQVPR